MKTRTSLEPWLLALGLIALVLFPLLGAKFYLQLFAKIMIMAVFAMSLDLLVGYAGLVSFGHAAFYGIGAYMLWWLSPQYAAANFWLTVPAAMAAAALAATAIGLLVLRCSGVYFIMATLAFAQMFFYFAAGSKFFGGSDGVYVYVKPATGFFDLGNTTQFYYLTLAALAATYLLLRGLIFTLFGRALLGIKSNEQRMRSLGFSTFGYKLAAFALAGALAGLAGYLDAAQFGFVNPDLFDWRLSGLALMMVILGGMGTLYGPIIGAFALVLLQDTLSDATRHWLLPMGVFIILAVLFLPRGVSGLLRRAEGKNG
jgi:branched-chain amino acid transport system permease protein